MSLAAAPIRTAYMYGDAFAIDHGIAAMFASPKQIGSTEPRADQRMAVRSS
jgi:hypothetical protein